jgi:hypothetical protein
MLQVHTTFPLFKTTQFLLLQDSSPKKLNNACTSYTPQNNFLGGTEETHKHLSQ